MCQSNGSAHGRNKCGISFATSLSGSRSLCVCLGRHGMYTQTQQKRDCWLHYPRYPKGNVHQMIDVQVEIFVLCLNEPKVHGGKWKSVFGPLMNLGRGDELARSCFCTLRYARCRISMVVHDRYLLARSWPHDASGDGSVVWLRCAALTRHVQRNSEVNFSPSW